MLHKFCQIIGFGPGAVSLLVAADRIGVLDDLLRAGLVIHEKAKSSDALLQRGINYDIISNSYAIEFIDGISNNGLLAPILQSPIARLLHQIGEAPVSLQLVVALQAQIRERIISLFNDYPQSQILFGSEVSHIRQLKTAYELHCTRYEPMCSSHLVLASGGAPTMPAMIEQLAQMTATPMLSADDFLRPQGCVLLPEQARSIAVVGSSHSAFSVLHKLLEEHLAEGQCLKLLFRDSIRRMHLSVEAAQHAGEIFDVKQDVCPSSGRVFRFQGLYTRSRRLYEQIIAGQHPQVELIHCPDLQSMQEALKGIDVVIPATGYAPRIPPLENALGQSLHLGSNGSATYVNAEGAVCDSNGQVLPGLWGIGLGFGRKQPFIGEPSYQGAPVGINIFQGPDGAAICKQLAETLFETERHIE